MVVRLVTGLALLAGVAAHADTLSGSGSPSPTSLFAIQENFVTGLGDVTDFRWLPDGRLVVINKSGNVLVRPAGGGALVAAGSFAVDTGSEKGLLGIAVDPDFATNRRLYFYYSAAAGTTANKHRVVVRTLRADNLLDPGETPLLSGLRGPANHDGGGIDIGPDGLLYVGVGDTGCNSNETPEQMLPPKNFYGTCLADDPTNLGGGNGKILRIELDGGIPPSNPLVGATNVTACGPTCGTPIDPGLLGDPRPEIFAWGFRNPFRLWVDPVTGRVWVGDVGEITYEEVTIVEPGRHHGWPWREGGRGHPVAACQTVRVGTGPMSEPLMDGDCVEPVYFCSHGSGGGGIDGGCQSITGGQIAESCTWPAPFRGRYVFADYVNSTLFTLVPNPARDGIVGGRADFATIEGGPVALRVGNDGALYIAVYPTGRIARIAAKTPGPCTTGCVADAECDDGNSCTTDHCEPLTTGCTHAPIVPCVPTTTSTTATTTTVTTVSTSSTLPASCAGLAGAALARCEVDAARGAPPCDTGLIDARFGTRVETALRRASILLERATAASRARKVNALVQRADRRLRAVLQMAARALRRDQIDDTCRSQVEALIARLRAAAAAAARR